MGHTPLEAEDSCRIMGRMCSRLGSEMHKAIQVLSTILLMAVLVLFAGSLASRELH